MRSMSYGQGSDGNGQHEVPRYYVRPYLSNGHASILGRRSVFDRTRPADAQLVAVAMNELDAALITDALNERDARERISS